MTATRKQKKLAQLIVEDAQRPVPMTAGELVEKGGYGPTVIKTPKKALDTQGVKEELGKLGFSLDDADNVVAFILKNGKKEESQLNAADKIYKRLGGYAPEKNLNINVEVKKNPEIGKLTDKLNEIYGGTGQ